MRTSKFFPVENTAVFKQQLLQWAQQFDEVVWLDSNDYKSSHSSFEAALAVDAFTAIQTDFTDAFDQLQEYRQLTSDWIFGYLSYDLKNDVEDLASRNFDGLGFPDLFFFQPKKLFLLKDNRVELQYLGMVDDEMEEDLEKILSLERGERKVESTVGRKEREEGKEEVAGGADSAGEVLIRSRMTREIYLEKVRQMQMHIQRGDIYEANFCQEFYVENAVLDPLRTFNSLNAISNPPFATFFKNYRHYLFSASPERYVKKDGNNLISQPIKGTARRADTPEEDAELIKALESDPKERSENVMIVDLVRNDLSRTAKKGSVVVEELCKVYTFKQVHQMISTIRAELAEGIPAVEVLRTTFPMGSMTGAPKIKAMKIIERLEETKRGLYSGAVGYFSPKEDFDFNVVIRSILYNEERKYVSTSVGGAITAKSIPEKEYEECLLKAGAMREVIGEQLRSTD